VRQLCGRRQIWGRGGEGLIVKGDDQVERCCDEN
jgi:hypothetical protein